MIWVGFTCVQLPEARGEELPRGHTERPALPGHIEPMGQSVHSAWPEVL